MWLRIDRVQGEISCNELSVAGTHDETRARPSTASPERTAVNLYRGSALDSPSMSNRFGIPASVELRLRARDTRCVYCGKVFSANSRRNMPSIEHLNERPPFYWQQGLREGGLAICCGSCNSSRGNKSLRDWFRTPYCTERATPINASTVAEPVKRYLRSAEKART
jgi:hypothetical protein